MGEIVVINDVDNQIEYLKQNSVYVAECFRSLPYDEILALKHALVMFAGANEVLMRKICELESIKPRIIDVDGRKMRFDVPTSQIEVERFKSGDKCGVPLTQRNG